MSLEDQDTLLMRRCFDLARQGSYHVKTNPQVGALIVNDNRIIGEGYHKVYGAAHAEIEALQSVSSQDRHLIKNGHMYVSLEPCFHDGKTPPCVDAILRHQLKRVTISVKDPNPKTAGKSINKLIEHGVEVRLGLLEEECKELLRPFFISQKTGLPFIILKWAQSKNHIIGQEDNQLWLSNEISRLMVHRWREEIDAIMVGTQTAILDNPKLTNRRGYGRSPIRVILDRHEKIPKSHHIFDDHSPTIICTTEAQYTVRSPSTTVMRLSQENWSIQKIIENLYQMGVAKLMVEGGKKLLQHCIDQNLWHQARVIHTPEHISHGLKIPNIKGQISDKIILGDDKCFIINNLDNKEFLI